MTTLTETTEIPHGTPVQINLPPGTDGVRRVAFGVTVDPAVYTPPDWHGGPIVSMPFVAVARFRIVFKDFEDKEAHPWDPDIEEKVDADGNVAVEFRDEDLTPGVAPWDLRAFEPDFGGGSGQGEGGEG